MAGTTLDLETVYIKDRLADGIVHHWIEWSMYRDLKINEWKEVRNYLFATDTRTTSNAKLPWANSTTTPKLTQIRDNLHANYMAALFPNDTWLRYKALDERSLSSVPIIQGYMKTKLEQSDFYTTASRLVLDYIDTGNVFGTVEFVNDFAKIEDGITVNRYTGPRLVRISPYDIVFNPVAANWVDTPKIVRRLVSMGELRKMVDHMADPDMARDALSRAREARVAVVNHNGEFAKSEGYVADGFGNIRLYYESNTIELLTFYGDWYDIENDQLFENHVITVADRAVVVENRPNDNWLGHAAIFHASWRQRPDNIYGMGPLDNLVGLQYRIDHLENMKADVWDQIAYPREKVFGEVLDYEFELGGKIYLGEEGNVEYLVPDATVLNADLQIQDLERKMEEMAGAPKQAMGLRTPGEKTAFEVSTLENAANRIFNHKTAHFERVFLEPVLNAMLEAGRRNLDGIEEINFRDDASSATIFTEVTQEMISSNGMIKPMGARHFVERSRRIQELSQLINLKLADQSVGVHLSGKKIAEILTRELGEMELYNEFSGIFEQLEAQRMADEAQIAEEEQSLIAEQAGL